MGKVKKSGIIVFIVCAFLTGTLKPFTGLNSQGHYIIAVTIISIALWIFKTDTMPYMAGAVLFFGGVFHLQGAPCDDNGGIYQFCRMGIDPGSFFRLCSSKNWSGEAYRILCLQDHRTELFDYYH